MTYLQAIDCDDITKAEATLELKKHGFSWTQFISENPDWLGSGEQLLEWLGY